MTYTAAELNQTGIYAIINLDTGKRYIGSAARSFRDRWLKHKSELRRNKHHSPYFQKAWNKYTEFRFEFKILEFVSPEYCLQREQWWMDLFGSYLEENGYNICLNAGSPTLGRKHSEETKEKIGRAHRGKFVSEETREKSRLSHLGYKHSEEAKKKVGDFWRGRKKSEETKAKMKAHKRSKEHIEKISQANTGKKRSDEQKLGMAKSKKPEGYYLLSPQGELFHFYNMSDFCKEHNLTISKVSQVINGKEKSHKKWRRAI